MSDLANAGATQETQSMSEIAANVVAAETVETGKTEVGKTDTGTGDNVDQFNDFIKNTAQKTDDLLTKVTQLENAQTKQSTERHLESVNKEISNAVKAINESVGGDAEIAELFLEKQYKDNPEFKKIWDNRAANPEAMDKAMDLMGKEWASKNKNVIDPQIAENQRALMDSQSTGGTVQQTTLDDKLDNMNDADFMRTMRSMGN